MTGSHFEKYFRIVLILFYKNFNKILSLPVINKINFCVYQKLGYNEATKFLAMKKINWGKLDNDVWPEYTEEEKRALMKGIEKASKAGIFDYHEKKRRFVIIYD